MRKTNRNSEIGDHISIFLEDREESRKPVSKLLTAGPSSYIPNYSYQFGKKKKIYEAAYAIRHRRAVAVLGD